MSVRGLSGEMSYTLLNPFEAALNLVSHWDSECMVSGGWTCKSMQGLLDTDRFLRDRPHDYAFKIR